MTSQPTVTTVSHDRLPGRAAIASGLFGILAVGSLIGYLLYRGGSDNLGVLAQQAHDLGVAIQFAFLIPVELGLHKSSQQQQYGMSQSMLTTGITAISFTILFLLLGLLKILADVLYMFPQGVFGVWLMIICWQKKGITSRGLRWFGMVVGLGLALVGIFPLGYTIFVDPIMLQIPAVSNEAVQKIPADSTANQILHQFVFVGSLLGVLTLPFWTLLLGRKLLQK